MIWWSTHFVWVDFYGSDADISYEEFASIQKQEHEALFGVPMDTFELELLELTFKLLDADKSGKIHYSEFMQYQATKKLGRRPKVWYQ